MQHTLFVNAPPYAILPLLTFLVVTHGLLHDSPLLSQDLKCTLEYGKVLSCTNGFDDLSFMCGVLCASEGAGEVGRERTEWPRSRDQGEYINNIQSFRLRAQKSRRLLRISILHVNFQQHFQHVVPIVWFLFIFCPCHTTTSCEPPTPIR
ncbi:hypothetical protein EV363DRAFT_1318357 [Boletus edulis]|nr:hypothetical protein EV363DRAFT_1318357 [Boletus edulis]